MQAQWNKMQMLLIRNGARQLREEDFYGKNMHDRENYSL